MNYTIREAYLSDAEAIWMLNCAEMGYPFPLESTIDKLAKLLYRNSDKIYVATIEGTVVGYVHANDYDVIYAPHMKNIMGIAVAHEHKHQGIGKTLLQQVELWAADTGATGVRLVSGASRTDAHEFYRHCGYTGDKKQLNLKKKL